MTTYSFQAYMDRQRRREQPAARPAAAPVVNGTSGPAYARAALNAELATLAATAEGGRNAQLNKSAFSLGQLVAAGHLDRHEVESALTATALATGLEPSEVRATIRSGIRGGANTPRDIPAQTETYEPNVAFTTLDEITGEITETTSPFWDARPVLTHIRRFALARMTSPWSVLGVTLLRTLHCIPPTVTLPPLIGGPGSLNLFCAIVGPSGVGKGATEAAAADAVQQPLDVYTASVGSGEGIAHQYAHRTRQGVERDRDAVLFTVPEVDTLTALGNRQGATLISQLRSAFSGERLGFGYADATKRIPIERHTYRLGMVVGVQPEKAGPILDDADGGLPQRFIWMPATDPAITSRPPKAPKSWAVEAHRWAQAVPADPVTWERHIHIPDEVTEAVREQHAARARGEGSALDGHAMFAREKVAVALAVLDGRTAVSLDDWALSGTVMLKSDHTRARVQHALGAKFEQAEQARTDRDARRQVAADNALAEAKVKRACATLLRHAEQAGRDGLGRGEARRILNSRDRDAFDEALARLADAGQVTVDGDGKGGKIRRLTDDR